MAGEDVGGGRLWRELGPRLQVSGPVCKESVATFAGLSRT